MATISIMAAMDEQRGIGHQGKLPWHLPADLARVHRIAKGQTFIMGRQSFQSEDVILSDHKNLILSNTICEINRPNSIRMASMQEALDQLEVDEQVLIMGGASVYKAALAFADKMLLTLVHHQFQVDTYFPKWEQKEWKITQQQDFPADTENPYPYSFVDFERIS